MKPLLRWAGGKTWLAPTIKRIFTNVGGYSQAMCFTEPFAGGAACTFFLEPHALMLNDACKPLMGFYASLGLNRGIGFSKRDWTVDLPQIAMTKNLYLKARTAYNTSLLVSPDYPISAELAMLFYLLNRHCFNGLYRTNKAGGFNVPYGNLAKPKMLWGNDFNPYISLLRTKRLYWLDGALFIRQMLPRNGFLFVDPPYHSTFTGYTAGGFTYAQQVELAETVALSPCPSIATNSDDPLMLKLYLGRGFDVWLVEAPRRMAANGNRLPVNEMFATQNIRPAIIETALREEKKTWQRIPSTSSSI